MSKPRLSIRKELVAVVPNLDKSEVIVFYFKRRLSNRPSFAGREFISHIVRKRAEFNSTPINLKELI